VATPQELAFFQRAISQFGEPALDLCCGTGRLLIPLLGAGVDVDGCDISADMIAYCRYNAEKLGLSPSLNVQAAHELTPSRPYGAIFICDSFGLGGNRHNDAAALRRCHEALLPGGALVFNYYPPYANKDRWRYWPVRGRRDLPEEWPQKSLRRTAADGDDIELHTRVLNFDPLAQRMTIEIKASLIRGGVVIAEERRTMQSSLYFYQELLMLLSSAGFSDVRVFADYEEKSISSDSNMFVFIARA